MLQTLTHYAIIRNDAVTKKKNKKIIARNAKKYQIGLIFFHVACNDFFIFLRCIADIAGMPHYVIFHATNCIVGTRLYIAIADVLKKVSHLKLYNDMSLKRKLNLYF